MDRRYTDVIRSEDCREPITSAPSSTSRHSVGLPPAEDALDVYPMPLFHDGSKQRSPGQVLVNGQQMFRKSWVLGDDSRSG